MDVSVHSDAEHMARAAASEIAATLAETTSPRATLGLAGGSTPRLTYTHLRLEPVDWTRVDLWLTDERWVPWDDESSNGRMATETLVHAVDANLLRPRWSPLLEPGDSAAFYEAALRHVHAGRMPDVALVGMGTDGHTASLFPGTVALDDPPEGRWFVANHVPGMNTWRLTVTPWLLRHCSRVIVLATGEEKARTLAEVFDGPPHTHPIQLLAEAGGEVSFYVDQAAASLLPDHVG